MNKTTGFAGAVLQEEGVRAAAVDGEALAGVRQARERLSLATRNEVRAVAEARAAGVTWEKIAAELGIMQPNAVRKYGASVKELLAAQPPAACSSTK